MFYLNLLINIILYHILFLIFYIFAKILFNHLLFYKKALSLQIEIKKYSELERLLRKMGCYKTSMEESGHPLWYSPITNNYFAVSHHHSREVASGTLLKILKDAGIR